MDTIFYEKFRRQIFIGIDLKGSFFAPLKWKLLISILTQNQTKINPHPPNFTIPSAPKNTPNCKNLKQKAQSNFVGFL